MSEVYTEFSIKIAKISSELRNKRIRNMLIMLNNTQEKTGRIKLIEKQFHTELNKKPININSLNDVLDDLESNIPIDVILINKLSK